MYFSERFRQANIGSHPFPDTGNLSTTFQALKPQFFPELTEKIGTHSFVMIPGQSDLNEPLGPLSPTMNRAQLCDIDSLEKTGVPELCVFRSGDGSSKASVFVVRRA